MPRFHLDAYDGVRPPDSRYHVDIVPSDIEPGCYGWVIRARGGRILARSPYASASRAAAELPAACWAGEVGASSPDRLRVLIAEDNVFYAEALRCLLARERHVVVGMADRAEDALAMAYAERPNFALVDVTLRDGCSGPELGRCLAHGGVCVLFLTATPALAPTEVPGVLGALPKPAGDARLLRAVAEAGTRIGSSQI